MKYHLLSSDKVILYIKGTQETKAISYTENVLIFMQP